MEAARQILHDANDWLTAAQITERLDSYVLPFLLLLTWRVETDAFGTVRKGSTLEAP